MFEEDVTTDNGWSWDTGDDGLTTGWIGQAARSGTDDQTLLDVRTVALDGVVSAGIEAATGEVRWTRPDAVIKCAGSLRDVLTVEAPLFACRSTGTVTLDGDSSVLSDDANFVLEGLDRRDGRAFWSHDVGRVPELGYADGGLVGLGGSVVALRSTSGSTTVVDLADGSLQDYEPTAHGWCPQDDWYALYLVGEEKESPAETYRTPCLADGTPAAAVSIDDGFGAVQEGPAGRTMFWADRDGIHAVREPAPTPQA